MANSNTDQVLSGLISRIPSSRKGEILRLASLGSVAVVPLNQKVKMLMARYMLRFTPPTGKRGGVNSEIARTWDVSSQYVHQVLWPKSESLLFANDGSGGYKYWQIWLTLTDIMFPGDSPPPRVQGQSDKAYEAIVADWKRRSDRARWWSRIERVISSIENGKKTILKSPRAQLANQIQNRIKRLGIKCNVEIIRSYPHTYIFTPIK